MSSLAIKSSIRDYEVFFSQSVYESLDAQLQPDDVIFIDKKVFSHLDEGVQQLITGNKHTFIAATEKQKSYPALIPIIEQLIEEWRGESKSFPDFLITYGSALIGALTFAFTDSHWFNAVEAEVYSLSTFFTSIVVWLILKWNTNSGHSGNVRYILIIAYMFGLAIGIHLLNLLALPFIALIVYFNKYEFKLGSFVATIGITLITFLVIYLGIIKGLPNMANSYGFNFSIVIILLIFVAMAYSVWKNYYQLSTILTCLVLIIIGFSTYATIFIRASQHPNINENNPDTIEGALAYMNRDQYGDWEILDPAFTLARGECSYSNRWTLNKSNPTQSEEINFLWNYQIKEMYLRLKMTSC